LFGVLIPLNFSLNELYPLSSVFCLSRKLDKLFEGRFLGMLFGDTFLGRLFERRKFILICWNTRPEMISFDEIHPDLQEKSVRDDFQRRNSS